MTQYVLDVIHEDKDVIREGVRKSKETMIEPCGIALQESLKKTNY